MKLNADMLIKNNNQSKSNGTFMPRDSNSLKWTMTVNPKQQQQMNNRVSQYLDFNVLSTTQGHLRTVNLRS